MMDSRPKPLDVAHLPLYGRHLIEASAGTGKTYNITRLYLRLLIEKRLSVQQILVMTFTNAATEEIRGRIADTLREALSIWQHTQSNHGQIEEGNDPVFQYLYEQQPGEKGIALLKAALLELDEAAVFTIHGFCKKMISQLAFESKIAMQQSLLTDTASLYLQATQDWIRILATQPKQYELLVERGWHEPSVFLGQFRQAIYTELVPFVPDVEAQNKDQTEYFFELQSTYDTSFTATKNHLLKHEPLIVETLVEGKKDASVRLQEWQVLLDWVSQKQLRVPEAEVARFINGNRYRGNEELKTIFQPLKDLIAEVKSAVIQFEKDAQSRSDNYASLALAKKGILFIRKHVEKQKRQLGVLDFDDLIRIFAEQISNPDTKVAKQLIDLYPAALIDEFQDTDSFQYRILNHVYPKRDESSLLMMIGDPKQAIYAFRGGDIFTYLQAARQADFRWVMDTNWRSVKEMVKAYNRLFFGKPLTEAPADVFGFDIRYEPVNFAEKAKAAKTPLADPAADRSAITYALLLTDARSSDNKATMQRGLATWLSNEIVRLLRQAKLGNDPVKPNDIAILVRSTAEATMVKQILVKAGLSAVFLSNKESLFTSAQVQDLLKLLTGIWHFTDNRSLRAALTSPLLGIRADSLIQLLNCEDEQPWDEIVTHMMQLKIMWQQQGAMSVIIHLLKHHFVSYGDDTERQVTNYMHLAEVLQHSAIPNRQGERLLLWLDEHMHNTALASEYIQRLESDAHLIQIITQHGSKGLEYPIVFVPFASDYRDPVKTGNLLAQQFRYYDEGSQSQRLQLGATYAAIKRCREEGNAEAMRLLYVAVTRAAHRCYLGVAPFSGSESSALAKACNVNSVDSWHEQLQSVSNEKCDTAVVLINSNEAQILDQAIRSDAESLSCKEFTGSVRDDWRLYSFSSIARFETITRQDQREREVIETQPAIESDIALTPSLPFRFSFEKGAAAGNLLHDLLEEKDFTLGTSIQNEWCENVSSILKRHNLLQEEHHSELFAWLDETLRTPLSTSNSNFTLSAIKKTKTIREAKFYFPLNELNSRKLSDLVNQHRREVVDDYVSLTMPDNQVLSGMMHGFIDLIFEWDGKYFVADYKSTHLGNAFEDYQLAQLAENNQHHLYDLQYLIYASALHRYLQQTLPNYNPQAHFGGVYYLYLRGMHPDNPQCEGVFFTKIDGAYLQELDAAFTDHSPMEARV
ncbi:exodeoxyribonuclease V subunit beta [Alteromonas sp. ASW11-130]|uniref:exodeoxyribonuclease V subunit beta n=1 Tax=Alteromonas sp. ASW11-130 TaxID=3015775 RepID=UPI002242B4D1|nr:exodeoxyribonuclease V subunit beta [Alteromonas sp. ASW11-130]MCW8090259.1 exodeoxyribonuclease V subunit beta [Alteromonas sp. ASW11-130]